MTFPCLVCGDVPVVDQPTPQVSSVETGTAATSSSGVRMNNGNPFSFTPPTTAASATSSFSSGNKKGGGTTIRTLSKDVSDKIFQNLCRHLYVKTEPYWFIQNPGEQMPLCAFCSGVVLEIYTLQTKMDQFQSMIKKLVWKLERIVADTEIAGNWMATREEQECEEEMWNSIPCPPMAIRIARERHHKFRLQILQNFKSKVKLRQKMRAAGQQADEMYDLEPGFTASLSESIFDNGEKSAEASSQNHPPQKRSRFDDLTNHQNIPGLLRTHLNQSPVPVSSSPLSSSRASHGASVTGSSRLHQSSNSTQQGTQHIKIPSTISVSAVGSSRGEHNQEEDEYLDDAEMEDEPNPQIYPDVQIVCTAGPADYFKEEHEYSNSGDGDGDSTIDSSYWNQTDDNMDEVEAMTIADGEDVVMLAPGLLLRKSFINQLLTENLKPSVFLRKLVFAVFGMKQVANSSGICGSNKPGAKPSLDRYKFEALREYTIETYGIRDNIVELEDLNRKIRTICCDARKALKRKTLKITTVSGHSNMHLESLAAATSSPAASTSSIQRNTPETTSHHPIGNIPDLFHLATGSLNGNSGDGATGEAEDEDDDDEHQIQNIPVSVTVEEQPDDVQD